MSAPSFAGCSALVTGGAGFIGSHLTEELVHRGAVVTVVDNLSEGKLEHLSGVVDRIAVQRLDLGVGAFEPLLRERTPEYIFHLAGSASVPDSVEEARTDFERNALASFNLLEAVRAAAPRTAIVFASSAAVYGEGAATPLREEDATVPLAPYGASKLAAERYMDVYARVYGLRTASLRLFPVFGPRLRRQVVWDLMRKLHANPNEITLEGDGSQVRDFTYVGNAVAALLLVAERAPLGGEVYTAADGRPVTIRELAAMVAANMGASPRIAWTGVVRPGVSQTWTADTSRIARLGFHPPVDLERGLEETVTWFRSQAEPALGVAGRAPGHGEPAK